MRSVPVASLKRLTWLLAAAGALAGAVSGCVPVVVGGAAAAGTVMAVDRRTTGSQVEDEGIELRAGNRINEAAGQGGHINITSYNRQVLLTGEVPNEAFKQKAQAAVAGTQNVSSVVNELAVMESSTLSQRSEDAYITGKVKASLIDAKDLSASTIKVVTERKVVYLMGRVTERESKRAAEIARGVSGVVKVVRVFEILSEQELKQISVNRTTGTNAAPVITDTSAGPVGGAKAAPATVVPAPAAAPATSTGVTTSPVTSSPVKPTNDGFTTKP
ncbi:BON domain-containing protein [Comamonas humi]